MAAPHRRRDAARFQPVRIGKNAVLRAVLDQIQKVGPTDATVLLLGESGTGKEVMASAIHQCSPRPSRLPVGVNCASVPDELFESEVFAHPAPSALPAAEQAASNNLMLSTELWLFRHDGDAPASKQNRGDP